MTTSDNSFDQLTDAEQQVLGSAEDFDWEATTRLPARTRPEMTQFSIRIERDLYEDVQALAEREGLRFSDVARAALREFVAGRAMPSVPTVEVSLGFTPLLVQFHGHVAQFSGNRRVQHVLEQPSEFDRRQAVTLAGQL